MEFFEVVKKRRSIHHFTAEDISDEDLNYYLKRLGGLRRQATASHGDS